MAALAKKAIAGDRAAFEELYSEHARSILFHVRSLIVDKENYTDVAQDVVLAMLERIHNLRNAYAFRGWMHQVVRTVCIDHNRVVLGMRDRMNDADNEDALLELEDESTSSDPEAVTLAAMEGNVLFGIVNELPENYREILAQRFYDDLSYKEIAEAQGISVTNVSTRLQRATEAIRKKLGETDVDFGVLDKGTAMKVTSTDTQGQAMDEGVKDISFEKGGSLKDSYLAGVPLLISNDTVSEFVVTTNAKIALTGSTTAAETAARGLSFGMKILIATVSAIVVVALATAGIVMIASGSTEPSSEAPATPAPESIDYGGSMHLEFVDENGNDSDRNIVEAVLVEDVAAAEQIDWTLYWLASSAPSDEAEGNASAQSSATQLSSGSGTTVEASTLASLEPGYYELVFTLVDANGAIAEVKRPFIIAE